MLQVPLLGPRDPESRGCRRIGRGLACILLGVVSIVSGFLMSRTANAQRALMERGVAVSGRISKVYAQGRSTVMVCYSFPLKDTRVWIEDRRVLSVIGEPRVGEAIPVWYDPADPQKCVCLAELSEGGGVTLLGAALGVGALLIVLGGVSIVFSMRRGGALLST